MAETVLRYETFVGISPTPHTNTPAFIHESFPMSSIYRRRSRAYVEMKDPILEKPRPEGTHRKERIMDVRLPRLPFDNQTTSPLKNQNCSYIRNQKSYLKMKGFNVNSVYSLNRHKAQKGMVNKSKSTLDLRKSDEINLPNLFKREKTWSSRRSKDSKTSKEDMWNPKESSKLKRNRAIFRSVRELDEEIPIPGFTPRADLKGNRLGKVLTTERMNALLNADEPVIPRAFYTEATILSPKSDVYN